jgi:hypothetical protein
MYNISFFLSFFVVLGLELRAYTSSHYTSPFFCEEFSPDTVSAWAGFKP